MKMMMKAWIGGAVIVIAAGLTHAQAAPVTTAGGFMAGADAGPLIAALLALVLLAQGGRRRLRM